MKYVCTHRCQHNGVIAKGDTIELTDLEYAIPHVRASFKPVGNQTDDSKKETVKTTAEKPLVNQNGNPLPSNAQISTDELKRKLTSAGVMFKDSASRQELFVLLQEALKPNTGTK